MEKCFSVKRRTTVSTISLSSFSLEGRALCEISPEVSVANETIDSGISYIRIENIPFFSVHGTEAAMSSRKQQKLQQRSGGLSLEVQEALVDIVRAELDKYYRKYGEGFQDEAQMLRMLLIRMQTDRNLIRRAIAMDVTPSDLEVALGKAKRQRAMRTSMAREWVTKSLPLFLNELRNGDISEFPNKAKYVEHFRQPEYDFDPGIISDKELEDIWTAYYRSNIKEIIGLTQQAQNRETVLTATTEFLADVVGGAVEGTAISDATNDILRGATRMATVLEVLPRFFDPGWQERARQSAQNIRDRPSPWLWPEVAYDEKWDPSGSR
jgi:hypothetical protein